MDAIDRGGRSRRRAGWILVLGLAAAGVMVPSADAAPTDSCGLGPLVAGILATAADGGRAELTLVLPNDRLVCPR